MPRLQVVGDMPPGEWRFGPFGGRAPVGGGARRDAEDRDRREWIEGVRRRLGLVAEVHRCHVERSTCGPEWAWSCLRADCDAFRVYYPAQPEALAGALAHARAFVPEPPADAPVTGLDLLAFDALADAAREQDEAFAAALPGRMAAVAGVINAGLAGILPEGVRFEWGP